MIRRKNMQAGNNPQASKSVETLKVVFMTGATDIGINGAGAVSIQFLGNEAVYFEGKSDQLFLIGEYQWEGPKFTTQAVTSSQVVGGSNSLKRAAVGGMIGGRRGALVGAATSKPGRVVEQTTQEQVEEPALAKVTLVNKISNQATVVSFMITTAVHNKLMELKRVPVTAPQVEQVTEVKQEDPMIEIRKFKNLLDDGIITQEEFDKKKKELLGL